MERSRPLAEMRVATFVGDGVSVSERELGAFAERLRGRLILPTNADYHEARAVWNGLIDKRPALIVMCAGTADVVEAVTFCRERAILVAVRSGGHSVAGHSTCDGGVIIDLSSMRGVRVEPGARTIRAEAGATWREVDHEAQAFGLATPGGQVSDTGIAGLTLGGGIGLLSRTYGLTCDNLLSADVVTADGRFLVASETENPDLLWALKGGGGNFGVVTSFTYRLHPVERTVMYVSRMYRPDVAYDVMRAYRDYALEAPDEVCLDATFVTAPYAAPYPRDVQGGPVLSVFGAYMGRMEDARRVLQPLKELGTPVADLSGAAGYLALQRRSDESYPPGQLHYWKSLYIDDASDAAIEALIRAGLERPSPATTVGWFRLGGALARVLPDATAYSRRDAPFLLGLESNWTNPHENDEQIAWTRGVWAAMQSYSRGGVYENFPGMGEEGSALLHSSYGPNYARLAEVKGRYDPDNMFRLNQNIVPMARVRTA